MSTIITPLVRRTLRTMLLSFGAGLLAGALFWLLHTHSPAPPWLGLTGLFGIVVGEQAIARGKAHRDTHRTVPHFSSQTSATDHDGDLRGS